ncbi:MAG TPA: hypothetical protein VGO07_01500 [Candidatus Saccharimonadales bacterium]|jgi:hypothetical protein|nr:hypothetical protein [Candidatus Saccharimonadales bacterium]
MKSIKGLGTRNVLLAGSGLIVVLLVAVGALFVKYNNLKKNPSGSASVTSNRIVQEVSKIYAVPTGEQPTVALVQDKTKLKNQPFFKAADNGDYILVYTNSKLAMIYREKENKLMNVGPINISGNNAAAGKSTGAAGAATATDTIKH